MVTALAAAGSDSFHRPIGHISIGISVSSTSRVSLIYSTKCSILSTHRITLRQPIYIVMASDSANIAQVKVSKSPDGLNNIIHKYIIIIFINAMFSVRHTFVVRQWLCVSVCVLPLCVCVCQCILLRIPTQYSSVL